MHHIQLHPLLPPMLLLLLGMLQGFFVWVDVFALPQFSRRPNTPEQQLAAMDRCGVGC